MNFVSRNTVLYELSGKNSPVLEVNPKEEVVFETYDCFTEQIKKPDDKFSNIGWDRINPATGPIAIKDAVPGDVLKVNIKDISVADFGVMITSPGFGVLGDEIKEETSKIIPINNKKAEFDNLKLSIKPMIGVIGTTLPNEDIPCGTPKGHGGNMDCKEIVAGSSVYLPVNHKGGLLALGDLHALMADGEVSMTGLEVSGKVTLDIEKISQMSSSLPLPMITNKENLIVIHSEKTLDEAVFVGTSKTVEFLTKFSTLSKEDAISLLSLVGQVKICQVVDPLMTIRIEIPLNILNRIGIYENKWTNMC
ncbi:acetamidase/formamidase family protein [Natranaerobius trueperi]|uniref:Acetamidase n=1 Tax=Natranaerobius trueperi TaxID=759412 RepID=A0A226C1U5_9FIRM|nr:acetamidase/formamidase family protein [Natranaerobius trueperi]OWZ84409.1 acetamidase [Natranaerobius trueperi]